MRFSPLLLFVSDRDGGVVFQGAEFNPDQLSTLTNLFCFFEGQVAQLSLVLLFDDQEGNRLHPLNRTKFSNLAATTFGMYFTIKVEQYPPHMGIFDMPLEDLIFDVCLDSRRPPVDKPEQESELRELTATAATRVHVLILYGIIWEKIETDKVERMVA